MREPLGERALIARIARRHPASSPWVPLPIGDDAAVLRPRPGKMLLATTDLLVEGVHFRRDWSPPEDIGYKALAVNLSDIAAMGGVPRQALLGLGLPRGTDPVEVDRMLEGMSALAEAAHVRLVGGDTVAAPGWFLAVTLLGEGEPGRIGTRAGARVGDLLVVTGSLGAAAQGLRLLEQGEDPGTPAGRAALLAQRRPVPRLAEGQALMAAGATALTDISDGLAAELLAMGEASGLGMVVLADALPLFPGIGRDPLDAALYGGEDYELLAALPPDGIGERILRVREETGISLTVIGEVRPAGEGVTMERDGRRAPLRDGFDHFREVEGS